MNDKKKELIAAFKCCAKLDCLSCPFIRDFESCDRLEESILDFINCQNAEIERLEGFADNMEYCANHALDDLEKEKAEAIKEFAERLKEKAFPDDSISCEMVVYVENIDNLVKEMVGEHDV